VVLGNSTVICLLVTVEEVVKGENLKEFYRTVKGGK
jgi:hypothetical protein